jgi:hypothetical protein
MFRSTHQDNREHNRRSGRRERPTHALTLVNALLVIAGCHCSGTTVKPEPIPDNDPNEGGGSGDPEEGGGDGTRIFPQELVLKSSVSSSWAVGQPCKRTDQTAPNNLHNITESGSYWVCKLP